MTIEHDVHTNVLLEPTFCMFPQQEHVFDVYDSFTSCTTLQPVFMDMVHTYGCG